MNLAIALTPKDFPRALIWARWVRALGGVEEVTAFVSHLPTVQAESLTEFVATLEDAFLTVKLMEYPGEDPGYPGGANRLFVFTMDAAAKTGKPTLWMETDAIPMRAGWFERIKADYEEQRFPFYGPFLHIYDTPHMNGTAVYPANWRKVSNIAQCPDFHPWDTFSRDSIAGKAFDTKLIFHSYRHCTFPRDAHHLKDEIEVFHPCKDVSLIEHLNKGMGLLSDEDFEITKEFFLIKNFNPLVDVVPNAFRHRNSGMSLGIFSLSTFGDYARMVRRRDMKRLSAEEYRVLLAQSEPVKYRKHEH